VNSTVAEFGRIDILHNNAALTASSFLSRDTTVSEMSLDVWQRTLEVNLGNDFDRRRDVRTRARGRRRVAPPLRAQLLLGPSWYAPVSGWWYQPLAA
jgi:NAD(P)-dependent dehydrogenase (short-subunit alcohol dehydrogenase family)